MRYFEALKIWNDEKKAGKWLLPQTEKDAIEILRIMNTGKKEEVKKVEKKKPRIRIGGKEVSKEEFKELKAKKARSEKEEKVKSFLKKAIGKFVQRKKAEREAKLLESMRNKEDISNFMDVLNYAEATAFDNMKEEELLDYNVYTHDGFILINKMYDNWNLSESRDLVNRGYRVRKNDAGGGEAKKRIKK
jgi:Na+/phosphate symporter